MLNSVNPLEVLRFYRCDENVGEQNYRFFNNLIPLEKGGARKSTGGEKNQAININFRKESYYV